MPTAFTTFPMTKKFNSIIFHNIKEDLLTYNNNINEPISAFDYYQDVEKNANVSIILILINQKTSRLKFKEMKK